MNSELQRLKNDLRLFGFIDQEIHRTVSECELVRPSETFDSAKYGARFLAIVHEGRVSPVVSNEGQQETGRPFGRGDYFVVDPALQAQFKIHPGTSVWILMESNW